MQLTDLLGHSVGLVRGAGHHPGWHRDAGLFQQPDAQVLVEGEVPLLLLQVGGLQLGHVASEQTRRTTEDLEEQEEQAEEFSYFMFHIYTNRRVINLLR